MSVLARELHQLEAETFEIHDVSDAELALNADPVEACCCSCSTSSTCGCSTSCSSTSSCG
ncbi:thiazolylpeptide-type bacteriocin [Actinokineospora sp.]|uniref:thiazolylpeptide-type bacteriocin n=1 Tax=Actinokineospora sp. TaxID=1872133 RepID=UPI00403795DA